MTRLPLRMLGVSLRIAALFLAVPDGCVVVLQDWISVEDMKHS